MKSKTFNFFLLLLMSVFTVACSTGDDSTEEYPDWKNNNDTFFANKYQQAKDSITAGDSANWKIIHTWSFSSAIRNENTDNIIVHVLNHGAGSGCPLYTDSVRVDYRGYLLKSASYTSAGDSELGYVFDQSWSGTYNLSTMLPTTLAVNGVVDGFATALQGMHIGDRWKVYIPYDLAYGSTAVSSIPAYSTLVFDITLDSYYHAGATLPALQVKKNGWIVK